MDINRIHLLKDNTYKKLQTLAKAKYLKSESSLIMGAIVYKVFIKRMKDHINWERFMEILLKKQFSTCSDLLDA